MGVRWGENCADGAKSTPKIILTTFPLSYANVTWHEEVLKCISWNIPDVSFVSFSRCHLSSNQSKFRKACIPCHSVSCHREECFIECHKELCSVCTDARPASTPSFHFSPFSHILCQSEVHAKEKSIHLLQSTN